MSYVDTPLGRIRFIGNCPPEWLSDSRPAVTQTSELLPKLSLERQLAELLVYLGAYFFTAPEETLWRRIWENVTQREQADVHQWMQTILTRSRPELTAICREQDCSHYIQTILQQWHALGYDGRIELQTADIRRMDRELYARFADFFMFMMGRLTYFRNLAACASRPHVSRPAQPDVLESIRKGTFDFTPLRDAYPGRTPAKEHDQPDVNPATKKKAKRKQTHRKAETSSARLLASGKPTRSRKTEASWDGETRVVGSYEFIGFTENQAQTIEQIISTLLPDSEHPVTRIELHLDQRKVSIRGTRRKIEQWNVDTDVIPVEGRLVIYPSFFSLKAVDQRRMVAYELQKCINFARIYTKPRDPGVENALHDLEETFPYWSPKTEPVTAYIDMLAQERTAERIPATEVTFYQNAMIMAFMRVEPDKIRERFLDADGNVFDAFQTMLCILDNTDKKTLARRVRAASKIPRITLKS